MNKKYNLIIFVSLLALLHTQYSIAQVGQVNTSPNQPQLMPMQDSQNPWTLDELNHVTWSEDDEEETFSIRYAKLQVLLNRQYASSGAIDGNMGLNTVKAISTFQIMSGLAGNGQLNQKTWDLLNKIDQAPTFIEYTLTKNDINGLYAKSIPNDYAEQAKMAGLYYTRVTEMLGEKFHMDEMFLIRINPHAKFNQIGEKILVTNVRKSLPKDIAYVVAHKGTKQLYLFNQKNKIIAAFPATIGSEDNPSPSGTHTIQNTVFNPHYSYNPRNFIQGKNLKPLSLPPGPNNPVGNVWIGLSKPSFGIHGTPQPALISKTASHGCIRLTNWDARDLARHLKKGTRVTFLE